MRNDTTQDHEQYLWSDESSAGVATTPLAVAPPQHPIAAAQARAHDLAAFVVLILCVLLLLLGSAVVTLLLRGMGG
jgi:hypothetical protein